MGFKFNNRHSDEFGMAVITSKISYIPSKRQTSIQVNGRDGEYIFEDGYNNIQNEFICKIGGYDIYERRKRARSIAAWLSSTGSLILDSEKDVEYRVVKSVSDVYASVFGREYREEFTVIFECEPFQKQTYYNDGLAWEDVDSGWEYSNIPWDGYDRTFTVNSGQTIDVVNGGTYKNFPLITLSGVASLVTIGDFTITNLDGTIYIDCHNRLVYSMNGASKVNKIGNFSGKFPQLNPGSNLFMITGSITNLIISFDYKNTYL
jgi:phage-related protein